MPDRRRGAGPVPVGDVLSKSRARRSGGVDRETWRRTVGPRVAERTAPAGLADGILTINVVSAVWAQELSLLSTTILAQLRERGLRVDRLRFRVSEVTPERRSVRTVVQPPRATLPPDLELRIDAIDDPDLRTSIREAAAFAMGRERK